MRLSHLVYLQLTFSRHWAAVCGDNKGAMSHMAFGMVHGPLGSMNEQLPSKPGNPGCLKLGLSTARHPLHLGLPGTHRNFVCWSLCAPLTCLYTSFSCQTREDS